MILGTIIVGSQYKSSLWEMIQSWTLNKATGGKRWIIPPEHILENKVTSFVNVEVIWGSITCN